MKKVVNLLFITVAFFFTGCSQSVEEKTVDQVGKVDSKAADIDSFLENIRDNDIDKGNNFFKYANGKWKDEEFESPFLKSFSITHSASNGFSFLKSINSPVYNALKTSFKNTIESEDVLNIKINSAFTEIDGITDFSSLASLMGNYTSSGILNIFKIENKVIGSSAIYLLDAGLSSSDISSNEAESMKALLLNTGIDDSNSSLFQTIYNDFSNLSIYFEKPFLKDAVEIEKIIKEPSFEDNDFMKSFVEGLGIPQKFIRTPGILLDRHFMNLDNIKTNYEYIPETAKPDLNNVKNYLKVCVLRYYSNLYSKIGTSITVSTSNKKDNAEEVFFTLVGSFNSQFMSSLNYTASKAYTEKYSPCEGSTEYIENMLNEIRTVFLNRLDSYKWMSSYTKKEAKEKAKAMNIIFLNKYQYNNDFLVTEDLFSGKDIFESLSILSKKSISSTVKANENSFDFEYYAAYSVGDFCYNCFHDQYTNKIIISSCFVNSLAFDLKKSDAFNYGSMGSIVGHEFTHGFDPLGASYDKTGSVRNWWSNSDTIEFKKLQNKVIQYYDSFDFAGGHKMSDIYFSNKNKTCSEYTNPENVADMGGLRLIFEAFTNRRMKEGISGAELVKEQQRFFNSFAFIYATNEENDTIYTDIIKSEDVHSPKEIRVNASVASMEEWRNCFNITDENKLYFPKDLIVNIW